MGRGAFQSMASVFIVGRMALKGDSGVRPKATSAARVPLPEVARSRLLATGDSEAAGLFEAVVAAVADDDVIEHRNAEHLACRREAPREFDIVGRRRGVA